MYTGKTWFPYNKGGDLRKWYGNNDYVVNWKDNGKEIRNVVGANGRIASRAQNTQFYFMSSITWSKIGTKKTSFRYKPNGHVFDVSGTSIFVNENVYQMYLLALLNTSIIENILAVMSPSLNFEVGQIAKLPVIIDKVNEITEITKINVTEAKEEWDSFEESWDFKKHPLI